MEIENGRMIFGYMAMKLAGPWDSQTVFHHNRAVYDAQGNWWVSKKSSQDAPNVNHPVPGFDANGDPVASEWWALWIDWQHPMARVLAAVQAALDAAANAQQQAEAARQAAVTASQVDVVLLGNRVQDLEDALDSLTDNDIADLKSAVQALQGLVGSDIDGTINKFNEIVAFLAGMGQSDTLQGKLQEFSNLLAQKQPAGDYATNSRVNGLEAMVGRYCSPCFVGDVLTFPAESSASFSDDVLVLTQ
jgi:hypothetical protein